MKHAVERDCRDYLPDLGKRRNRHLRNGHLTACPECGALFLSGIRYGEMGHRYHAWREVPR